MTKYTYYRIGNIYFRVTDNTVEEARFKSYWQPSFLWKVRALRKPNFIVKHFFKSMCPVEISEKDLPLIYEDSKALIKAWLSL